MTSEELQIILPEVEEKNKLLAEKIFGVTKESSSQNSIIQEVEIRICCKLEEIGFSSWNNGKRDTRSGRLGPDTVIFDKHSRSYDGFFVEVDKDPLHLNSRGNFSSIRANVCVFSGKWQYELTLGSQGVMQLGWDLNEENVFTNEFGVGDTIKSFAYDGNRKRKWNFSTSQYGEYWLSGDVIGCTIDLDNGSIFFFRNGKPLGEAFTNIEMGAGCGYFPTISLARNETVVANFGGTPFRYPIDGFEPIQQPPTESMNQASLILNWFQKLLELCEEEDYILGEFKNEADDCKETSILMFARLLIKYLYQFLDNSYVMEACLVPFLEKLANVSSLIEDDQPLITDYKIKVFFEMLFLFMQDEVFGILKTTIKYSVSRFNQVSTDLEFIQQRQCLKFLISLLQIDQIRDCLLRKSYFVLYRLPECMNLKPFDAIVSNEIVPKTWWESDTGSLDDPDEERKNMYLTSCKEIAVGVKRIELLQLNLLEVLLQNNEENAFIQSSRTIFINMFRYFLKKICLVKSKVLPEHSSAILHCYFQRLLLILRRLWEMEMQLEEPHVMVSKFYENTFEFFNMQRFGGTWSFLIKKYRNMLISRLGEAEFLKVKDSDLNRESHPMGPFDTFSIEVSNVNQAGQMVPIGFFHLRDLSTRDDSNTWLKNIKQKQMEDGLMEMLDGLVMFYHHTVHKQFQGINKFRLKLKKYVEAMNQAHEKLKEAKKNRPEVVVELTNSLLVFETKVDYLSRKMAWIHSVIFSSSNESNLLWLLTAVLKTLKLASQDGDFFAFIPEFYIETLIEMSFALRNYFGHNLEQSEDYTVIMTEVADFLASHFSDTRIVNPNVNDCTIHGLAWFVTNQRGLTCLEHISQSSQGKMITDLLKPYDDRPWAHTNWVLLRFWHGCGFAYRYQKSPHIMGPKLLFNDSILMHHTFKPCPSLLYQKLIEKIMLCDEEISSAFINSALNQLNWVFSEVIGMLQKIKEFSLSELESIRTNQFLVCSTCFDFTLGLLRVFEMIITVCKPLFTDFKRLNSENLLERLCQILCLILLRVSSADGCFEYVISLNIHELETIHQFPILAALIGVMIALLDGDESHDAKTESEISPVVKTLLSDPGFEIKNLLYVLGEDDRAKNKNEKPFSFLAYPDAVNEHEINEVRRIIQIFTKCEQILSTGVKETPDDELCMICCALPMSVTLRPCLHKSCK
uniref:B30.2/SPRY domain-containing protein n=1 Tax=Clastoptera arizonana TaxID=38151 RepID=A0A1B6D141_9HEMI